MNEELIGKIVAVRDSGSTPESKEKLSRLLHEEGLAEPGGVADFLTRLMEHFRTSAPSPMREVDAELNAIDERRGGDVEIVHRPPALQFYWRGEAIEPQDIRRFDGQPLHFALIGDDSETRLMAFESHREVREALRHQATLLGERRSAPGGGETSGRDEGTVDTHVRPAAVSLQAPNGTIIVGQGNGYVTCPPGVPRPTAEAQFFQHRNFEGHWFWLAPNWRIPDLTRKDLSRSIFSPGEWNDQISSVKAGDGLLILYEHIHFRGSTLTLQGSGEPTPTYTPHPACGPIVNGWVYPRARHQIPHLGDFGWNDRASSIEHYL